jgi:hypothetical protein
MSEIPAYDDSSKTTILSFVLFYCSPAVGDAAEKLCGIELKLAPQRIYSVVKEL